LIGERFNGKSNPFGLLFFVILRITKKRHKVQGTRYKAQGTRKIQGARAKSQERYKTGRSINLAEVSFGNHY